MKHVAVVGLIGCIIVNSFNTSVVMGVWAVFLSTMYLTAVWKGE